MKCTYELRLENGDRRMVFREPSRNATVIVQIAHRGGCLYLGEIILRDDTNGKTKTISTTNGFMNDTNGTTNAYLSGLWTKHFGI